MVVEKNVRVTERFFDNHYKIPNREMLFECNHISFAYRAEPVIRDFSMSFEAGKFYGIIGPNGSGKTTVLDLLSNHIHPVEGNIYYQGKNISSYPKKALSRELALVPQDFYIRFAFTVKQIVMMGRYPHIPRFASPSADDTAMVEDIMDKTGVGKFANRFITELSGGERQRVVFARALAQNTAVLILDEATSNLDINYAISLLNLSEKRVREHGATVISVMQDINLAAVYCDYLLFLNRGQIAAHGPTREVLTPESIQAVFNINAKVYRESFSDSLQVVFKK